MLRADTTEELQQKIAEHGKQEYNLDIATMPEEQKQRVMSLIRQQ